MARSCCLQFIDLTAGSVADELRGPHMLEPVSEDFRLLDEAEMGPNEEECWLVGPEDREIIFARVPETKTVKNRMHLCGRPTDRTREEEVDRIIALGATLVDDRRDGPDKGWAVLADPQGNESAFSPVTPQGSDERR